eukprot:3235059-Amphidinium_carterae.1
MVGACTSVFGYETARFIFLECVIETKTVTGTEVAADSASMNPQSQNARIRSHRLSKALENLVKKNTVTVLRASCHSVTLQHGGKLSLVARFYTTVRVPLKTPYGHGRKVNS